jgi:uncharacterized protein with HEPN domain
MSISSHPKDFILSSGTRSKKRSNMSERRSSDLLLYDILQSIEKIEEYIHNISLEKLLHDERTKDAILRNIQVIGDASKNLPAEFIEKHPDIDWRGIAGMRNIITHRCFHVDWYLVWTSIWETASS